MTDDQRQSVSDALFAAALAHDTGRFDTIDRGFEEFSGRIRRISIESADLSIAFRFWDAWIDAASHEWQSPEAIHEDDWPRLAREIAGDLASATPITSPIVLSEFGLERQIGVPLRGCIRAASAAVGTLIGLVGIVQALSSDSHIGLALFFIGWGAFMWFPVLAKPATSRAIVASKERLARKACHVCVVLALLAYALAWVLERRLISVRSASTTASDIGLLGGALWLVFFLLQLFAVYYQSQLDNLRRRREK